MMYYNEYLQQVIRTYFSSKYKHDLTDDETSNLASILLSNGVNLDLISSVMNGPNDSKNENERTFMLNDIYELWKVFMPIMKNFKENHLLQIFCKGILYPHLLNLNQNDTIVLSQIFREKSKGSANLQFTQFIFSSYLGNSEFKIAKSLNNTNSDIAAQYYENCICHLMTSRKINNTINISYNYKMVGTSHYFLGITQSLTTEEKLSHLFLAVDNFELDESFDKTTDHYIYLGNAYQEIAKINKDFKLYFKALEKMERAYKQTPKDPNVIANLAPCHLNLGIYYTLTNKDAEGVYNLEKAIYLYDEYFKLPKGLTKYSENAALGRQGQAYLWIWSTKREILLLDKAINNLRIANESNPTWRHTLAHALIERFSECGNISDLQGAKELNDIYHNSDDKNNKDHLKQRGMIYQKLGNILFDEKSQKHALDAYEVALNSYLGCLPSEDFEIKYYIGMILGSRGIKLGSIDDLKSAIKWLEEANELNKLLNPEETRIGILPKVYRELAKMISIEDPKEALSLIDKAINILENRLSQNKSMDSKALSEYYGLLGGNYHIKYKISKLPGDILNAIEYDQKAYDVGFRDPSFLGHFGRVCLQRGKINGSLFSVNSRFSDYLNKGIIPDEMRHDFKNNGFLLSQKCIIEKKRGWRISDNENSRIYYIKKIRKAGKFYELHIYISDDLEDQKGFLEDAIKYLTESESEGNKDKSLYSELGDAYYRLFQIQKDKELLNKALHMFQESCNKGNDSPENYGLIGDCYYRLSRYENSLENLNNTIKCKEKARQAGHESREHYSLVGRINLSFFKETGDKNYFMNCIKSICEAGRIDEKWPWSVCQLAEIVEHYPELIDQIKTQELEFCYPNELVWMQFLQRDSRNLWLEGAKLAANSQEIREEILGGKSDVYFAEDLHGLISATYVFKPNIFKENLREEQERTIQMNRLLEQLNLKKFLTPIPLGILSLDKTELYVMRRAAGRNLSVLIKQNDSHCDTAIQNTIEFLALYHAWNSGFEEDRDETMQETMNRLNRLRRAVQKNHLKDSLVDEILNLIEPLFKIIELLPIVEKKDAHPDNWIVTNQNEIVMIDLEKPKPRSEFMLFGLVQLVETLSHLPWNEDGMKQRKIFIDSYLNYYNKILEIKCLSKIDIPPEIQVAGYLSFAYYYALWGIAYTITKELGKGASSSSRSNLGIQREHYFEIINSIPYIWSNEKISFNAPDWSRITALVNEIMNASI